MEVRQHDQYVISVDGSSRPTVRNRQFLRVYTPRTPPPRRIEITDDMRYLPAPPSEEVTLPAPQTLVAVPDSNGGDVTLPSPVPPPSPPLPPLTPPVPTIATDVTPSTTTTTTTTTTTGTTPPPTTRVKKPPLALRRLASYNREGRIGLTLQDTADNS